MMELLIKAKDILVEYSGRDVLDIDDLELYEYDRIGLVGANGAGKSTLLKVPLGKFLCPTVKLFGKATSVIFPSWMMSSCKRSRTTL